MPEGSLGRARYGGLCGLTALVLCLPTAIRAQEEISVYQLTGVEGNVTLRYVQDSLLTESESFVSHEKRPSFEEEVSILTHGYVYHPNFLKVDLGGGPLFVRNRLETDTGNNSSNDTLYNLVGRFSFLEQKLYPFTLYYEHVNPTVSLGMADQFMQTTTKAGANASLLQPLLPVSLNLDAFRQESAGKGFGVTQNDINNQATLRAFRSLGDSGYGQFTYQTSQRESISGNPNLPIQESTNNLDEVTFDSRSLYGDRRQFNFTQMMSYSTQEFTIAGVPFTPFRDFRFTPEMRWEHDPDKSSFYRYSLFTSVQGVQETINQSAVAGLTQRWSERLRTSTDIHMEQNQTTGLDQSVKGFTGYANYAHAVRFGKLRVSGGYRNDRLDRDAVVNQIAKLGEHISLQDSLAVPLTAEFVIASSVVVSNQNRTQTYSLNVDYELVVIGSRTSVRRLIGGAILDGQDVLVDYSYETGGNFRYSARDLSILVNLNIHRFYDIFMGHQYAPQRLLSGNPTIPLNTIHHTQYGVRASVPLTDFLEVGGEARHERRQEDIAPYVRVSYDAYAQFPLPTVSNSQLRVAGRRVSVDNIGSPEDVDAHGWTLRLQARPWSNSLVNGERNYDKDTGGTVPRETWTTVIQAEWRVRQLTLRAEGRQSHEDQGGFIRERTLVRLLARRDF